MTEYKCVNDFWSNCLDTARWEIEHQKIAASTKQNAHCMIYYKCNLDKSTCGFNSSYQKKKEEPKVVFEQEAKVEPEVKEAIMNTTKEVIEENSSLESFTIPDNNQKEEHKKAFKIYLAIGELSKHRIKLFTQCKVEQVLISFADIQCDSNISLPFPDVIMDSGAFSVTTRSAKISLEAYSLWLQLNLSKYPQIKHYINLDDLNDPKISLQNLAKLESDGLKPMPVYHYGEPTEVLNHLCSKYEYIGLGGLAVGKMPTKELQKYWEWVYETYKDNKFHVLGVGTMKPFYNVQPYSVDSTSWISLHGEIMGYLKGKPARINLRDEYGFQSFFPYEHLLINNILATVDWGKGEWIKEVKKDNMKINSSIRMF